MEGPFVICIFILLGTSTKQEDFANAKLSPKSEEIKCIKTY